MKTRCDARPQISALLDELGPEAVLFLSPDGRLRVADAMRAPALPDALRGRTVALRIADPLLLGAAVLACEGLADGVFLLPVGVEPEVARGLLRDCACAAVLTDVDETAAWLPEGTAIERLAQIPGRSSTLRPEATGWIFATSGTTGTPKLVRHTIDSLTRLTGRNVSAGRQHRWGGLYELTRFAGFQVFLQALFGGSPLIVTRDSDPVPLRVQQLASLGCTALSATPTMWRKILMSPQSRELRLRQVTLGGEIADDAVLTALRSRFPEARIVHIFASTEAGAGFAVVDGRAGFPADYLENAPRGVELRIREGTLWIKNALVHPAYLGEQERFVDAQGFVDTRDAVQLRGGRWYFLGRVDGSINVGGNKVQPEEVETLLLRHDAVRLARVSGKKNPITGQIVMAEVVADDEIDGKALIAELKGICAQALEPYKRPAVIRLVETLEVSSSGKITRSG